MQIVRYLTLYQLKAFLGEDQSNPIYDPKFNQAINEASRLVDHLCRPRYFHPRFITSSYNVASMRLARVYDLNEIISWTRDDLAQDNNDLDLEPDDGPPYNLVALKEQSVAPDFGNYERGSLKITGFYGYLNQLMPLGFLDADILSNSVSLDSSSDIPFIETYAGRYLRIDNELMFISAVSGTTTFVVIRGINGTAAVDHSAASQIYIWDPMDIIQMMARVIAARIVQIPQGAGVAFIEASGKAPFGGVITPEIMQTLEELVPAVGE